MNAEFEAGQPAISTQLHQLIAKHGLWRIIAALPGAILWNRSAPPQAERILSDHLRRDIGLAPLARPRDRGPGRW